MQSGNLNQYIEVQQKMVEQAQDKSGDREEVWVNIFPIYGHITDSSVRDLIAAGKEQSAVACRIMIRQSDVLPGTDWTKCRLVCDGLYYRIIRPLRDNKTGNEYLTFACEQGVYKWQDSN
ncbi:head-tail adaptor protein [Acinetobacter pittii]|nr:head-tail adaptor protein [Acinetobacter pittii]UFN54653.1 head-tail adaptor protein [Acinetobacter pittii]